MPSWVPDRTSKGIEGKPVIFIRALKDRKVLNMFPEYCMATFWDWKECELAKLAERRIIVPGYMSYSVMTKCLSISWWPDNKIQPDDCVWYLSGNAGLFILWPYSYHWLFLSVTKLRGPYYNERASGTHTTTLILNNNFHSLRENFEEEIVEIHWERRAYRINWNTRPGLIFSGVLIPEYRPGLI
jgi:hypothetical protein